ncbi:tRNA-splicing endonuclease subunit Sen54-like [Dendronephthya gigantea]|uniref:tRNA-splicing endonuclease subunit Sen54-like n=1 Tax=Dendronephthya gigantea TaxID=151771 RepID=UPI00106C901E|nr:tRNA-splicing endonuclease subunit Sen54-like [Dendronephthya gigantea]
MDFHKSAEELQTLRKKLTEAQMPCRSGPKDSVVDGSDGQAERLEEQLHEMEDVLSEERILRKGNISVGKWNGERRLVEVLIAKGVHWNVFGKSINGHLVLEPDEALYMLDHGMLELFHNDLPVSLQQAYDLLLSDEFPLHEYVVYSYLRNLGYIVLRYKRGNLMEHTENKVDKEMGKMTDTLLDKSMEIDVDVKNTSQEKVIYKREDPKEEFEDVKKERVGRIIDEKIVEDKKAQPDFELGDLEKKVEEKEVESEHEIVEKKNTPVSHYWEDKESRPLVHPSDATSLENILNKLQVIQGQTRQEASQHTTECKFQITYDVFQPQKNFRKTNPGLPNYCICVCKFSEPPPTIGEMNFMASQAHPVPLKYAVIDGRDVSFYSILDVQLPTYVER